MSLPIPSLDDRRFQDFVDEAKRMIPRFCPEWTDHNVSDPGITLVELFAWMTEQYIFRLNQVHAIHARGLEVDKRGDLVDVRLERTEPRAARAAETVHGANKPAGAVGPVMIRLCCQ